MGGAVHDGLGPVGRPARRPAVEHTGPVAGTSVRVARAAGRISSHHIGRAAVEFRQEIVLFVESA